MAYVSTSTWKIDGSINLTKICEAANWHHASCIDGLIAAGLSRDDATAFARFAGNDYCAARGGRVDCPAQDELSESQWDRLS